MDTSVSPDTTEMTPNNVSSELDERDLLTLQNNLIPLSRTGYMACGLYLGIVDYLLNLRMTKKVIGGVWVVCCFICGLPLVGVNSYTYEPFGTSCTIDWDDDSPLSFAYVYLLVVVAYTLPVGTMSYCYTKVVMRSGKLIKAMKASKGKTLNLGEAEEANTTIAENKVTWISLLMVVVFVVVWSPYMIVSVWAIYDSKIPVWVNTLPTMFAKASCMLNPVIFYLTNPTFRVAFKATFMRKSPRVGPLKGPGGYVASKQDRGQTFKVDKTKDGIFIGETNVTFRKAETTMF